VPRAEWREQCRQQSEPMNSVATCIPYIGCFPQIKFASLSDTHWRQPSRGGGAPPPTAPVQAIHQACCVPFVATSVAPTADTMSATIAVAVKHGAVEHRVAIAADASVGALKAALEAPTGLVPRQQKLIHKVTRCWSWPQPALSCIASQRTTHARTNTRTHTSAGQGAGGQPGPGQLQGGGRRQAHAAGPAGVCVCLCSKGAAGL
jgi:hypothetical protein